MDAADLAFAGPSRQAELVREGEVSSRELVELYLERIERIDPGLNAYRVVLAERALAEADQADSRRAGGGDRPLLGVPIAVKDDQDVAGEVTARGTDAYGDPAREDSKMVSLLRAAGAVVLGKTNVPELEIMGSTESPTWGVTRNPWDPDRTPGGSSGGAAAAVAAGLASAATGSDGAGSIRIPAACCGLVGLKTQRDRITLAPRQEVWHGLDVYGFLTRSVADTALLLDVAATQDEGAARPAWAEAASRAAGRLRIGFTARPPVPGPVDEAVRAGLDDTAEALRSLGHSVEERNPAWLAASPAATVRYLRAISDDAAAMPRPERLQRRTRGFARMGGAIPDAVLARARAAEAGDAARIGRVFEDCNVLMTPTIASLPVKAAEWEGLPAWRTLLGMAMAYPYTVIWNHTGQPALAVPAGFTDDGVPLSVQLVGREGDEATLLSLAAQLEAERPWADRRPPVA